MELEGVVWPNHFVLVWIYSGLKAETQEGASTRGIQRADVSAEGEVVAEVEERLRYRIKLFGRKS